MGMKQQAVAYSVHVEPRRLGDFGCMSMPDRWIESDESARLESYRERCEEIVRDIKRHVDDVGSASVQAETENVCEHCGLGWTEVETSPHNGGCCAEDEAIMEAADAGEEIHG